jgi:hypothetical protein
MEMAIMWLMNMKTFIGIILIIISPMMMASFAAAGTDNTSIHASARVLPYLQYDINHQAVNLTITQQDIDRGFIEVKKAISYSIRTNSRNGHLLVYSADNSLFKEILLLGNHYSHAMSGSWGEIHMPYQGNHYFTSELGFRFNLSANFKPGTYNWPVAITISSI